MKRLIIGFWIAILGLTAFAQHHTNIPYFKLAVYNDKGEVLMVKYKGRWELIGSAFNESLNVVETVKKMGMQAKIETEDIRLRGVFSTYYDKGPYPMLFHYYTSKHKSGKIEVPEGCEEAAWFSVKDAIKTITLEEMGNFIKLIDGNDHLWGGSYAVMNGQIPDKRAIVQKEEYYILNAGK